jgi:hypothetical protein
MSYYVALRGLGDLWSSLSKPKAPTDANWYGETGAAIKASPMGAYLAAVRSQIPDFAVNDPRHDYPSFDLGDPNEDDRGFMCRTIPPGLVASGKPPDRTVSTNVDWLFRDASVATWCKDWNVETARLVGGTPGASAQLLRQAAERFGSWEFDKRHHDWVKGQIAVRNLFNKK